MWKVSPWKVQPAELVSFPFAVPGRDHIELPSANGPPPQQDTAKLLNDLNPLTNIGTKLVLVKSIKNVLPVDANVITHGPEPPAGITAGSERSNESVLQYEPTGVKSIHPLAAPFADASTTNEEPDRLQYRQEPSSIVNEGPDQLSAVESIQPTHE